MDLVSNTFSGQQPLSSWKSAVNPHKAGGFILIESFGTAESISFC